MGIIIAFTLLCAYVVIYLGEVYLRKWIARKKVSKIICHVPNRNYPLGVRVVIILAIVGIQWPIFIAFKRNFEPQLLYIQLTTYCFYLVGGLVTLFESFQEISITDQGIFVPRRFIPWNAIQRYKIEPARNKGQIKLLIISKKNALSVFLPTIYSTHTIDASSQALIAQTIKAYTGIDPIIPFQSED